MTTILSRPPVETGDGSDQVGSVTVCGLHVTVSVAAPPVTWGAWRPGSLAVISCEGGGLDRARCFGAARRWTTVFSVSRYRAAMALHLSGDLAAGMTVPQLCAAILTVANCGDEDTELAIIDGENSARVIHRCAAAGVPVTTRERAEYRQCWPPASRTALCLALADRLMTAAWDEAAIAADRSASGWCD